MLLSDSVAVLQWWSVLFLLGVGFLPLTMLLFEKFFDRGYIFAKLIGVLFTSYTIFLLGIMHVVKFQAASSYIIFILLALLCFFLIPNKWKLLYLLKKTWKLFIFEEILFLIALFAWSYVRSFSPDIHGLEKYMDFGFVNSILRSEYFPPKDMWFTPHFINYYYFGHLVTAVLTQLSGLQASFTFNIMIATIFAFCFVETFSLGGTLYTIMRQTAKIRKVNQLIAGVVTACLVTLAGNLHILYAFFKQYAVDKPQPFWELAFLPLTFPNSYWYPNATRYIYHTIHEFPIYSWVVSDLHGHVLDIPFVLLTVAVLFALFLSHAPGEVTEETIPAEKKKAWFTLPGIDHVEQFFSAFLINPLFLILLGFLLAVMYMTNAWDGAIYMILTVFVISFLHWRKIPEYKNMYPKNEPLVILAPNNKSQKKQLFSLPNKWLLVWLVNILLSLSFIVTTFYVFAAPYNIFFKPFVSGIGVLCAPDFLVELKRLGPLLFEADHCEHSFWWELLTLYGFFFFFITVFGFFIAKTKKLLYSDIFVMLLIALGTLLILIPEFIYVKDIYPAHYRANTMFKLVFQSFIILSISSSYIIFRLLSPSPEENKPRKKLLFYPFLLLTILLISAVMTYPYLAIKSYYGDLKEYKWLHGTVYLKTLYPTDYDGIEWLNKNVKGQPVILEAQGDSYTDYARVSSNTGLPTVLGWTVHEWLWRGTYDIPAPRIEEIKTLYEATDSAAIKPLLTKHNIQYIFVGDLERQKYPTISEEKFKEVGDIVFEKGNTKIYKIR